MKHWDMDKIKEVIKENYEGTYGINQAQEK